MFCVRYMQRYYNIRWIPLYVYINQKWMSHTHETNNILEWVEKRGETNMAANNSKRYERQQEGLEICVCGGWNGMVYVMNCVPACVWSACKTTAPTLVANTHMYIIQDLNVAVIKIPSISWAHAICRYFDMFCMLCRRVGAHENTQVAAVFHGLSIMCLHVCHISQELPTTTVFLVSLYLHILHTEYNILVIASSSPSPPCDALVSCLSVVLPVVSSCTVLGWGDQAVIYLMIIIIITYHWFNNLQIQYKTTRIKYGMSCTSCYQVSIIMQSTQTKCMVHIQKQVCMCCLL